MDVDAFVHVCVYVYVFAYVYLYVYVFWFVICICVCVCTYIHEAGTFASDVTVWVVCIEKITSNVCSSLQRNHAISQYGCQETIAMALHGIAIISCFGFCFPSNILEQRER